MAADSFRELRVDVLEMDVADAVRVVADELRRVHAADQQVAGVQAPLDIGVLEREGDVPLGLEQRAGMRVQDELEAVSRDGAGERVQALARALPAVGVEEI